MIPVSQTIFDFNHGNCFQACVASLFEVKLGKIPAFMKDGPEKFWKNLNIWCDSQNLIALGIEFLEDAWKNFNDTYFIANGISPRDPVKKEKRHAVIWYNGDMAHDPHPSGDGLIDGVEFFTVFIVKDMTLYAEEKLALFHAQNHMV